MSEQNKLIVDLSGQDREILWRLRDHLEVPIATIVRWAIRYYAMHGPVLYGWSKKRPNLLDGFEELVTGLGIREQVACADNAAEQQTPPPSPTRRKASKG